MTACSKPRDASAISSRTDHGKTDVPAATHHTMTGQLLSLNIGRPREVHWRGKTVRTAIWKKPVDGPRMVRRINIDGDDQADRLAHGGEHRAVFVYQIDSYCYWERELVAVEPDSARSCRHGRRGRRGR